MLKDDQQIWFNGKLVPWREATVSVLAHAIHYGSSVFEGIRAYKTNDGPKIFRLGVHLQRLFDSAKIYRIPVPYTMEEIASACCETVRANKLEAAYLRPIIYRGFGGLGVVAPPATPTEVAIAALQWGTYLGEGALENGVETCVSSWRRVAPDTLPAMAKAGGTYLSSQLIAMEAKRLGFVEAISLDINGYVAEGPGENIFLVKGGVLSTPPLSSSILPGITRDAIITLARDAGFDVREELIPRERLYMADEIFFTGTAAEITPVRGVDGIQVGAGKRGPVTAKLQELFFGLFDGKTEDRHGWLEAV